MSTSLIDYFFKQFRAEIQTIVKLFKEGGFGGSTEEPVAPKQIQMIPMVGIAYPVGQPVTKTPQFHKNRKGTIIMAFELSTGFQVPVAVEFRDRKGNPAPVEGTPEWSTDNSELLAISPSEDGMSCNVASVGPIGTATVTLSADADLGAGVRSIIGTLEVSVTTGGATEVVLTPGEASEIPTPAPTE